MVEPEHPVSPGSVGKWLCHYTTADAAFEYILPMGQLRMSPYRLMRDPLEERDLTFSAAYFPDAIPAAEEGYWNLVARIARVRGEMRLLSLTMDADHYDEGDFLYAFGWARARLWEQYASNHAGVCLVFERERLHAALQSSLDQQGTSHRGAVEYSPRGFYDSPSRNVVDANLLDPRTQGNESSSGYARATLTSSSARPTTGAASTSTATCSPPRERITPSQTSATRWRA